MTYLLHQTKYLLGTNKIDQYSLVEVLNKKWLEMKMIQKTTIMNYLL
jgi:hypothetical protein